eukprot:1150646-Pelagomonas_calceolata.AAC.7
MLTGEDQSQADQPNNLAEGPPVRGKRMPGQMADNPPDPHYLGCSWLAFSWWDSLLIALINVSYP